MNIMSKNKIKERLLSLKEWHYPKDKIEKEFEFKDFKEALSFVLKIGIEAEKMDHHPDILMHSWNKVKIFISTHSAGGITTLDFKLAKAIETLIK